MHNTLESKKTDYFFIEVFTRNKESLGGAIIKKYLNNHTEVNQTVAKIANNRSNCHFNSFDLSKDEGGMYYYPWVVVNGVGKHRKTYVTVGVGLKGKLIINKILDFLN